MGIKLDYARAKAEADLHRFLEIGYQNAPDALGAAVCYLKTFAAGLIVEYLRPDSQFPEAAVEDFRRAIDEAEGYLWKCHFRAVAFLCDCDFSEADFSRGVYSELSRLQDHAVTEFWSGRAEHFAKLGGEPLPAVVSAGLDNKPSDEPARPELPNVVGAAASGSSKSEQAGGAVPTTVANTGNATGRRGAEITLGSAPLSLADRTEIEQQLHQWREGIWIDITLLLEWSGELKDTTPPESMEYFQHLNPWLRNESFLRLAFDWEGSGTEVLSHDQITATLLNNLRKALRRYVQRAIDLISSKWADKGIHPSAFASRMESAGGAIQHDVVEMLKDGVSSLAHGTSTDSLEQTLSEEVKTGIARKSDLYLRNAQLTGLCELPERDDVVAEYRATDESVSPLLEDVSTPPLRAREQTDTARADGTESHAPKPATRPRKPTRIRLKDRPRLTGEALRRIEHSKRELLQSIEREIAPYSPSHPNFRFWEPEIDRCCFRVIDHLCALAEALFDAAASEYTECSPESVANRDILRVLVLPEAESEVDRLWNGWWCDLQERLIAESKHGEGDHTDTGFWKMFIKYGELDPPKSSNVGQLIERYDEHLKASLEARIAYWQGAGHRCQTQGTREQSLIESSKAASLATSGAGAITTTGPSAGEGQLPAVENRAALGVKSGTAKQECPKQRPGKERQGDASLLAGKHAVSFRTAEQYLGITERQRQNLVKGQSLIVVGKGHHRKITTDSLRVCLPPENPN